ncbi:MAG: efflux system protein [Caulobacteraceae bacterium]|nr:efflux system protein [Caulobacteraceae bacterium]
MPPRITVALLAVLALSACASPRKPDLRLPTAFEAPQPAAETVALDQWWTAFNDPQLTQLIDQALVANPDARTAASRLREVRAQRASALAQLLPTGDAKAAASRTDNRQLSGTPITIPGFSNRGISEAYSANFDVSWEIDLFGRLFSAAKAANADYAAQRFAYEGARATLAAQVADAYFQARGLAIQLDDARETVRIQGGLYDIADKRAAAGLAATADPDRIAGDLAQAQAQAASLEAELQVERRTLLILAGRTAEPTANMPLPASVGEAPPVPATLPSELLARRPDVREAERRVASAAGLQDVAARAFFPTFTLTPGLGWSKSVQPNYRSTSQNWSIGGNVSQPVLSIPRLIADLKVQNARTEQAVIAYEKVVQTAFQESEAALVRLDADRRGVAGLTDGEMRAARAFKAAQLGYSLGLTDLEQALSAERTWRATRTQLTSAQVQALRRTVQAYQALGGGWPQSAYPAPPKAR